MIRRPPRSTRTDTRFPYTTLFRSRPASNLTRMSAMMLTKAKIRNDQSASHHRRVLDGRNAPDVGAPWARIQRQPRHSVLAGFGSLALPHLESRTLSKPDLSSPAEAVVIDRKSVVSGKSVSV